MNGYLEKASLCDLGEIIDTDDTPNAVDKQLAAVEEVLSRLDHDLDVVKHFMDFHYKKFNNEPSPTNWCELIAMLFAHQHLTCNLSNSADAERKNDDTRQS